MIGHAALIGLVAGVIGAAFVRSLWLIAAGVAVAVVGALAWLVLVLFWPLLAGLAVLAAVYAGSIVWRAAGPPRYPPEIPQDWE
jgi:hypothetical protein